MTLVVTGGVDKMSFHITPINGYRLKDWSFAPFDVETFGRRQTYFVFLTYGHEAPVDRTFWVLLENVRSLLKILILSFRTTRARPTRRLLVAWSLP